MTTTRPIETIAHRATLPTLTNPSNRDVGLPCDVYFDVTGADEVTVMEAGCTYSPVFVMTKDEARARWSHWSKAMGYRRTN